MKYMWSNRDVIGSVNMPTGNDFVINTEYNNIMLDNLERTSPKRVKRFRSAFTTDQVNYLEMQFKKFPYIGNAHRKEVASALNISERAVKIWFQNRRMKEKKEIIGKECDDEPSNRKSQEFVKDQLINVGKPSANDQPPYSLPLLTDDNKADGDNIMMTNNSSCSMKTGLLIADSGFKAFELQKRIKTINSAPPFIQPRHLIAPNSKSKTEQLSVDMCKKYKYESTSKPDIVKDLDIKPTTEQKPKNFKHIEQMTPEDLSRRKVNVPATSQIQVPNIVPNNPGYISVVPTVSPFYAQPYYTASGVIWKPVNVVSTAPATSMPPAIQESVPKMCCSCDCHIKPLTSYNVQQQSPSPQYIFTAVQLPNPSGAKY